MTLMDSVAGEPNGGLPWVAGLRATTPWQPGALIGIVVINVAVGTLILVAAYQAAQQAQIEDAITWLAVAIGLLVASGVVQGIWVARTRQAVQQRLSAHQASRAGCVAALRDIHAPSAAPTASDATVVHAAGAARFHRGSCAFALRRAVTHVSASDLLRDGIVPCEVCRP